MRRLKLIVVLLVAAFVAAEPAVHMHPMFAGHGRDDSSRSVCPACAATSAQPVSQVAAIIAPAVIIYRLVPAVLSLASRDASIPLASRAPPAC